MKHNGQYPAFVTMLLKTCINTVRCQVEEAFVVLDSETESQSITMQKMHY